MKEIGIIDQTFRDAHQCLWACRMSTAMMLKVADRMDRIGFKEMEIGLNGGVADVAIRHLKENPFERLRLVRQKINNTPLLAGKRSRNDLAFKIIPMDIALLWIERMLANGCRRFRVNDPLQDLDNIIPFLTYAKELGAYTVGALAYGHSPIHTDEMYVAKTKELIERANVDAIMLKDAGGLLTPERVRTLVPAMRKAMGNRTFELHTHCMTGLGPLVYIEGVKLGVDEIHTSIAPLANGAAQPAMQTMVRNLRGMGYTINTDDKLVDEVSEHFHKVCEQEGLPKGQPAEYDAFHYEHQVPGGMISNLKSQLKDAGLSDKLPAVLHECVRIRAELGYPIMITPFAQIIGTQAVLNVVNGERYKIVPNEVKAYVLGHNGKLLAPVDPDVLDRIMENGSRAITAEIKEPPPGVEALRKKYPNMSDEERLLRHSYAGNQIDEMLAAGPIKTEYSYDQPLVRFLKEVSKRPNLKYVHVSGAGFEAELRAS